MYIYMNIYIYIYISGRLACSADAVTDRAAHILTRFEKRVIIVDNISPRVPVKHCSRFEKRVIIVDTRFEKRSRFENYCSRFEKRVIIVDNIVCNISPRVPVKVD